MILSPLMGVFFGAIFAGLTNTPPSQAPRTVIQTKRIYVTRVIVQRGQNNSTDDGIAILFILGIAILFILWKYAIYANMVHKYVAYFLSISISFSITAIILSYFKGQFTSIEWVVYLLSPLIFLVGCFYLLNLAHKTFDPKITEAALNNNLWLFYTKSLTEYGRFFILTHVLGIVLVCTVALFSFMALLHYLSLMNQRSDGMMKNIWYFIARATMFFSGKVWLILSAVMIFFAYICIEPNLGAKWLSSNMH